MWIKHLHRYLSDDVFCAICVKRLLIGVLSALTQLRRFGLLQAVLLL
jgi:hypothetical protein